HEPPVAVPVARPAVQVVAFRAGTTARRSGVMKGRSRLPAERLARSHPTALVGTNDLDADLDMVWQVDVAVKSDESHLLISGHRCLLFVIAGVRRVAFLGGEEIATPPRGDRIAVVLGPVERPAFVKVIDGGGNAEIPGGDHRLPAEVLFT